LVVLGALTIGLASPLAAQSPSVSAVGTCAASLSPPGAGEAVEASDVRGTVSFCGFQSLSGKQQALLRQHFRARSDAEAAGEWQAFASRRPTHAATFLATTHALGRTRIDVGDSSRTTTALDLLTRVDVLLDDRVEGELDHPLLERWQAHGGRFEIEGADGKVHKGVLRFDKGDLAGSVHYGYVRQGYTSRSAPRIQFQLDMPRADGTMAAQVDVDYRSPWKGGVIPNPLHLRHDNSVVLDHLRTYEAFFGNPGFEIRPAEGTSK
jgi:hypothetical protein